MKALKDALSGARGPQLAALLLVLLVLYALVTPLLMSDPFQLSGMSILDAFTPPFWMPDAQPGMPLGAPGMAVAGEPAEPYDVLAFGPGGSVRPFMSFGR